jgi:hypothetical protein
MTRREVGQLLVKIVHRGGGRIFADNLNRSIRVSNQSRSRIASFPRRFE